MVKRSKKLLFRLASKRNKAKDRLFRLALKRNEKIRSTTKRTKIFFGSKTKQKYALLILLWSEVQKFEAKRSKKKKFSRERAKRISFRFKAKHFFCETGAPYSHPPFAPPTLL